MAYFEDPTPKYPVTGIMHRVVGFADGAMIRQEVQEVDQIVEECRYLRNYHPRNGMNPGRFRQHVARLPMAVVNMLFARGMNPLRGEDDPAFVKWLNSAEAAPWRTSNGGV